MSDKSERRWPRDRRLRRAMLTASEKEWMVQMLEYVPCMPRDRLVYGAYLNGASLDQIAATHDVSRERVRQLLSRVDERLQSTSKIVFFSWTIADLKIEKELYAPKYAPRQR